MRIMYCYIEPWVVNQNVYLMNDGIEPVVTDKISLEDLPVYLVNAYKEKNCDKIIVLNKGRIEESGKYDELIAQNGIFSDMYYGKLK